MTDPTFKALSLLLTYPSPPLLDALPAIGDVLIADRRLDRRVRGALAALIDELQRAEPLAAEERYVATFDRGRATSLHLFEHVHGDSRDRGQAMVDLLAVYESAGLRMSTHELPDYLPALLEFAGLQPFDVARDMLGDTAHLLRRIGNALRARESRYASVLAAVLALLDEPGLDHDAPSASPPEEDGALDDQWAEAPVVFGPSAAPSCGGAPPQQAVVHFVPRNART